MNKLKELSKKKWFIVLVIVLAIALVGGLGTYAMFSWISTDNTNVTLKIGDIADVTFPQGQELNTNNLTPVFNYNDGETLTFSIKNKDTTGANIKYMVNFNITNIDEELANSSLKYKLVSGNNVIGEGNFSTATSNSTMKLADGNLPAGTSNYTLYLYIDGNIENDVSMMNKNIRGTIEVTAEELVPFNLAQHITNLYTNAEKTEVINNSITYNYATNVGLMKDRLGGTSATQDSGKIRYYGESPNNWIDIGDKTVNEVRQGNWLSAGAPFADETACNNWATSGNITNEQIQQITNNNYTTVADFCSVSTVPAGTPILWRIIGVFDGKLRVRRDENIGATFAFDVSQSTINGGYGINQWGASGNYEGADLMKLLNPGYENNLDKDYEGTDVTVNNSLYWNSGSGNCYAWDEANSRWGVFPCDFTNSGLSDEAKEYVVDQTLYLGGFDTTSVFANEAWANERGTNVFDSTKSCYGQNYCNDGLPRTLTWTGKVGLIYPSDFGYAADFSNDNCKGDLSTFSSSGCTANWMAQGYSWTVSPWASIADYEVYVNMGNFNRYRAYDYYGGWPTLLLNSSVMALGTGSKDDPYVLQ